MKYVMYFCFVDDVIYSRNKAESIRRRYVWSSSPGGSTSRPTTLLLQDNEYSYYYYYYDEDEPSLKRKSRRQPLKPEAGRIMSALKRARRPTRVARPHHGADARRGRSNQQQKVARVNVTLFLKLFLLHHRHHSRNYKNCLRSRTEVRPTALLRYHAHSPWILTSDHNLWHWLSIPAELCSWPTHKTLELKGQSVQKIEWKQTDGQTDTTDTFPANPIGNKSPLPLTDPRDAEPHAHRVVHRCRWSVW